MTAWRHKPTLIEMVANLRASGISFRCIAATIGISHTHARRVWNLFVRDSANQLN